MRYQGKNMETSSKCAELDVFVRALLQTGSTTVTDGQVGRGCAAGEARCNTRRHVITARLLPVH
jgi:hypothetical protein